MTTQITSSLTTKLSQIKSEFQENLAGIRSSRATPSLIDGVEIEAYGAKMKLKDLAHISTPEPKLLLVQPWDAAQVETIAKGLTSANLGMTPAVDGGIIRLPLPTLTEERRGELVRLVHAKLEEAKVETRQARQDAFQSLARAEKEGTIGEDERKRTESALQRLVDQASAELEANSLAKENEVKTI